MTTNKISNSSAFEESDHTINHELSQEEMQAIVGGLGGLSLDATVSSMVTINSLSSSVTSQYISNPIKPIAVSTVMCPW